MVSVAGWGIIFGLERGPMRLNHETGGALGLLELCLLVFGAGPSPAQPIGEEGKDINPNVA